ncbi:VOC family protein [Streptomyces sp. ICBB 8177]|uniref:VOC family protein n=1 Tax=Streptomyces sp. ICBB 8177 TaxID=563922 RepID=UPI001F53FE4B|nr:VOC family protein [Streptomyces sp. ICBB 8177]
MTSDATPRPAGGSPRLTSIVIFVHDLEESTAFYRDLLLMELATRSTSAALLANAGGDQVYLRAIGARGEHPFGSVGTQYAIWTAADQRDLERCEQLLKERSAHVATTTASGLTLVEGRDPNGLAFMVTHPGPDQAARDEIMARVYAW